MSSDDPFQVEGSRPATPQDAASVRSQAVAKLRRAASLPRKPIPRRPSHNNNNINEGDPSAASSYQEGLGHGQAQAQFEDASEPTFPTLATPLSAFGIGAGPGASAGMGSGVEHNYDHYNYAGQEEMLSPSPVVDYNPHQPVGYTYGPPHGQGQGYLQRSASSSSLRPTPPHLHPWAHSHGHSQGHSAASTPYESGSSASPSPLPEWSMGIANQYMPQLSPVPPLGHGHGHGQSPFLHPAGRNTPSPLPTLGELRTISRSNSTAARARAMDKLTGGSGSGSGSGTAREISPAPPLAPAGAVGVESETPTRPGLQRADSLGSRTHAPVALTDMHAQHPPSAFMEPRPRLQRSFTVSSSNMGVERRSAVGRRMVARLAERAADKQAEVDQQEAEVRRLWEERTGRADQDQEQEREREQERELHGDQLDQAEDRFGIPAGGGRSGPADGIEQERDHSTTHHPVVVVRDSIESVPAETYERAQDSLMPPIDDRPGSRNTQMSDTDAFEYAQHLSRSQSTRTARNMPITPEQPAVDAGHGDGSLGDDTPAEQEETLQTSLLETPHKSLAPITQRQSPSAESVTGDALNSMMIVMGQRSSAAQPTRQASNGFPIGVEEQSGEWGTPTKDTRTSNPYSSLMAASVNLPRTVSDSVRTPSNHSQPSQTDHDLTPPGVSTRTSVMSWEEVGGDPDRAVPSDELYHRKIGSIGAKVGSAVRAMRKRSQSRSSTGSGPTSPGVGARPLQEALSIAVAGFSRRESETSLSPTSGRSTGRTSHAHTPGAHAHGRMPSATGNGHDQIRHHPSMSSLSPSLHASTETSTANSILLQHQLSNDPQSIHEMPRARMDDPRVYNSKLSPFPGVDRPVPNPFDAHAPRLIHQHSDSVVPTHTHTPGKSVEIHALPLVTPPEEHAAKFPSPSPTKRSSTDSKKGWFAKTLASATSPRSPRSSNRSSAVPSRKSSMTDMREAANASHALAAALDSPRMGTFQYRQQQSPVLAQVPSKHPTFALPDNDIFGGALQAPVSKAPTRSRPISPSVSTVAELNEDGHRLTQFTAFRSANQTPVMEEELRPRHPGTGKDQGMLDRMEDILEMEAEDPGRLDVLDDPPRKLLLAMQVLQIVDENAAKDRYLLLFGDILIIAKPILPAAHAGPVTLDMPFVVKSVIPLDRLQVAGLDKVSRKQDKADFAHRFAQNPFSACHLSDDPARVAETLVSTPGLDAVQMGSLLSHPNNAALLSAFVSALHLRGAALVDSLRVFLLAAALPEDQASGDALLDGFAEGWHAANRPPYTADLTIELLHSLIHLSDEIHGNRFGFALRNPSVSADGFIASFRARDHGHTADDASLRGMYRSIETAPLMPPLPTGHASARRMEVMNMPSKLKFDAWSEEVTVRIPQADSDLCIMLQGDGLEFEPSFLDFRQSGEQTFSMRRTGLGARAVLMVRQGLNAPLYSNLPAAHPVSIERAYMLHTFHLAHSTPAGGRRRYCISVPDAASRSKWAMHLPRQINRCRTTAATSSIEAEQGSAEAKRRQAAEALGLAVLRDSLVSPPLTADSTNGADGSIRRGSVSATYALGAGRAEQETLGPLAMKRADFGDGHATNGAATPVTMTGKEIVLVCRQNSLLPDMLDLLKPSAGDGDGDSHIARGDEVAQDPDMTVRFPAGASSAMEEDSFRKQRELTKAEVEDREREFGNDSRAQSRAGRF